MEQQDKIRILFDLQEHPERYTDEELKELLDNDQQLAELFDTAIITKRSLAMEEAENEELAIDDLWQEFSTKHADELGALNEADEQHANSLHSNISRWNVRKIAAIFAGAILTIGISFAAVWMTRHFSLMATPSSEQQADTVVSVRKAAPVHFDNVPLDSILGVVSAHYGKKVVFNNEEPRSMKLIMTWQPDAPLTAFIERINAFEVLSLEQHGDTIIVEQIVEDEE